MKKILLITVLGLTGLFANIEAKNKEMNTDLEEKVLKSLIMKNELYKFTKKEQLKKSFKTCYDRLTKIEEETEGKVYYLDYKEYLIKKCIIDKSEENNKTINK